MQFDWLDTRRESLGKWEREAKEERSARSHSGETKGGGAWGRIKTAELGTFRKVQTPHTPYTQRSSSVTSKSLASGVNTSSHSKTWLLVKSYGKITLARCLLNIAASHLQAHISLRFDHTAETVYSNTRSGAFPPRCPAVWLELWFSGELDR